MSTTERSWVERKTVDLPHYRVSLSAPVPVGRSRNYFWFPNLWLLPNGDLLSTIAPNGDIHMASYPYLATWSRDGGLTWTEPLVLSDGGQTLLTLGSGDAFLLPFDLRRWAGDLGSGYNRFPAGRRTFEYVAPGVVVTGLPRPDNPKLKDFDAAGFVFNGQTLQLRDGAYLATIYGQFAGDEGCSLLVVESTDGARWKVRSLVSDKKSCPLPGKEGPGESAIVRARDGRLLCVYRVGSTFPLGQSWSSDEGRTWTTPVAMRGPFSVQPSLALFDGGALALASGRPGLYLWLNAAGDSLDWEQIDILAHHNACCPAERIEYSEDLQRQRTTAYTEVVAVDDNHLLYIYDRIPNGWRGIPEEMNDTNSVWLVRATVSRR